MDPVTNPSNPGETPGDDLKALAQQYRRLERLLTWSLAAMLLVVFSINIYFSREAKVAQYRCNQVEVQLDGLKQIQPLIRDFVGALQQYAAQDKEFIPIWERYRPALTDYLPSQKSHVPAPSPAAAPKK